MKSFLSLILCLLTLSSLLDRAHGLALDPHKTAPGVFGENPNIPTGYDLWLAAELQPETQDWLPQTVSDVAIGPNLYTYVTQNPWTYFDPLGLKIPRNADEAQKQVDDFNMTVSASADAMGMAIEHYREKKGSDYAGLSANLSAAAQHMKTELEVFLHYQNSNLSEEQFEFLQGLVDAGNGSHFITSGRVNIDEMFVLDDPGIQDMSIPFVGAGMDISGVRGLATLIAGGGKMAINGLFRSAPRSIEFMGSGAQHFISDLSHVTGKAAASRNRAIAASITEDLPNLKLTYTPQYNPLISQGVAQQGTGTQIGARMFESRAALRNTIVHEELHHRWWKRGILNHHPRGSAREAKFYETIHRYERMRGWKK